MSWAALQIDISAARRGPLGVLRGGFRHHRCFAAFGLFTSLAPGFIAGTLGDRSHALAGLAAFVMFGAAALAQIALSRAATSRQLRIGLTALILGLAVVTIAVWLPSFTLFLLGGALAGGGAGAAFKGSISMVVAIAPPSRRGETLAGLFLAAYFGISVPVPGLGLATQFISAQTAVAGFAAVLVAVAAMASHWLAGGPGHGGPPAGPAESPPNGGQVPAIATVGRGCGRLPRPTRNQQFSSGRRSSGVTSTGISGPPPAGRGNAGSSWRWRSGAARRSRRSRSTASAASISSATATTGSPSPPPPASRPSTPTSPRYSPPRHPTAQRGRWRPDPPAETLNGPFAGSAAVGDLLDALKEARGKRADAPSRATEDLQSSLTSEPPATPGHPGRDATMISNVNRQVPRG